MTNSPRGCSNGEPSLTDEQDVEGFAPSDGPTTEGSAAHLDEDGLGEQLEAGLPLDLGRLLGSRGEDGGPSSDNGGSWTTSEGSLVAPAR
jgi:hypothetical protein